MSTFVYNDGSFDPEKKGVLSVTFGLFFDGTKNNRYHTEIRKKIDKFNDLKTQRYEKNNFNFNDIYFATH